MEARIMKSEVGLAVPALKLPLLAVEPTPCCSAGRCRFRLPLMRVWLIAVRQAGIAHEPLADVIHHRVSNSRTVDPWIRGGGRVDPQASQDIAMSLERARDVGGIALVPANAERISAWCCPFALKDS